MSIARPKVDSAEADGSRAERTNRAAVAALFGVGAAVMLALALLPPYAGDMSHFKMWTRTVTLEGLHNAYNGTWPETYAVYPPVTLATYWLVGQAYRMLADPAFALAPALASPLLAYLLKLPGITFHLLTGAALYRLAAPVGQRTALGATAAYLFNPAALFDLCYWGQPDAVYGLFALLAAAGTSGGPLTLGWAALAAAIFAKPQAWALGPVLAVAGLLLHGRAQVWRGAVTGAIVAAGVLAPFALGGRLPQLATLPGVMNEVQPAVSANAHNLWWLVTAGAGLNVTDTAPPGVTPPLVTSRTVGYALWGAATLLALAAVVRRREPATVLESAAFVAFAFVMLATRIH
ncbi:MAG: hypothetical protein NTZ05_09570, partial [Chloroflexi bacterium]|nr:hypothetical protein [Chloroflexota bacterium]